MKISPSMHLAKDYFRRILILLSLWTFAAQATPAATAVKDTFVPAPPTAVLLPGRLGAKLDLCIDVSGAVMQQFMV
jgi:hypothetical protein